MFHSSFQIPDSLIQALRNSSFLAVLTGAGISAESDVPTFRDAQTGLWAKYNPHELATAQAFRKDPRLVWEWYSWRRSIIKKARPNSGHLALVELEKLVSRMVLITQNVDGLHLQAGSRNVIEIHGNIMRNKCFDDGQIVHEWLPGGDFPPHCPRCGGLIRPDVVWFGESLSREVLSASYQAIEICDLFFSIGTSALVQPAASFPLEAQRNGATIVEINPKSTPLTPYTDYFLQGPAGSILPALVDFTFHK